MIKFGKFEIDITGLYFAVVGIVAVGVLIIAIIREVGKIVCG